MNVEVLGNVQDGGVPHLGCGCEICRAAHDDPSTAKYVTSIILREEGENCTASYLIDASPDIRFQIEVEYIDGVFVPHAELGHVTGLLYFGAEGPDASGLNVYCNEGVKDFLMKNDPYRYLVDRGNIEIHTKGEVGMDLRGGKIGFHQFDHTLLDDKTTGYMVQGEKNKLFYLADIDQFTDEVIDLVEEADIAIIDGTFYSKDEIDRYEEVAHPLIQDTMDLMDDLDTEIHFIHMNHTNPVLRQDSEEREEVENRGFHIAEQGDKFEI